MFDADPATDPARIQLLGSRSLCQAMDISDRCLRRWIAAGKFPRADVRIGSTLRWRASTVKRWIEDNTVPT